MTGSTPCEREARGRLFSFYDWCAQHDDIPELITLATTIARWEDEITAAVVTGITNATSESLNRLAKLEARLAYGFRNPLNQRRRVRIACTRGYRRRSRTATPRQTSRSRPATRSWLAGHRADSDDPSAGTAISRQSPRRWLPAIAGGPRRLARGLILPMQPRRHRL